MRAYHATHDEPKIFDDPVAPRLLTATERAFWETRFRTYLSQLDPDHLTALKHAIAPQPVLLTSFHVPAMPRIPWQKR
jgi:hypothetical protein